MQNKLIKLGAVILTLSVYINSVSAEIVKDEKGNVDYTKTSCLEGLNVYIQENGEVYNNWIKEHFGNPDFVSNLNRDAFTYYKQYRDSLENELQKYTSKSGTLLSTNTEILNQCETMVSSELESRRKYIKSLVTSLSGDKRTLRISTRLATLNTRALENIHTPFSNLLGRMKSFSDRLPCYTVKCTK